MIVIDTNIIAYLILTGEKTILAKQALTIENQWIVPTLWRHEFLNVLVTSIRSQAINVGDALAAWQNGLEVVGGREQDVPMEAALKLAAANQISAYDAQFVALAQLLGIWLVTEDRQLQRKFPEMACSLSQFLSMKKGDNGDK